MNKLIKFSLCVCLIVVGLCGWSQTKELKTEWVFIYYMPYDNNLSQYGNEILKMIRDSISSEKVIATMQADFEDSLGMTRYIITKDTVYKSQVKSEFSANTKTYEDYLLWVESKIKYKKKANVFLDHGGRLDELCMDENPELSFLKVDSLKNVFQHVYRKNKIDLLFLQVCNKGSIEPLFEFKDVANFTLCSQIPLGAPNYYYHTLFSRLSRSTIVSGNEVGKIIIENERDDMYNSYTLVDNSKLDKFFTLFTDFINSAIVQNKLKLSAQPLNFEYFSQKYWDLISFINAVNDASRKELNAAKSKLIDYIKTQLIFVKLNPKVNEVKGSCGLSIYARGKGDNRKMYKNLEFNKQIKEFPSIEYGK